MKQILSLLVLMLGFLAMSFTSLQPSLKNTTHPSPSPEGKIQWISFQEAIAKSKEQPKKIFVDVYTDWCTWCFKMEKSTFTHPAIVEYVNENFYPVKLDAEMKSDVVFHGETYSFNPNEGKYGTHEIAMYLTRGRLNYPSVVFLDESRKNPQPIPGFQNSVSMDQLLKFFGEDYYTEIEWGLFKQIYESPLQAGNKSNNNLYGQGSVN